MLGIKSITSLFYYPLCGFIYLLSFLPLAVLYLFADLLFFFSYYVLPYRKKVVRKNLKNSFPEKSEKERLQIERKFYRHFCDLIFESLKGISISPERMKDRVVVKNPELLQKAITDQKGILLLSSHYANFEWMNSRMGIFFKDEVPTETRPCGLYRPFKNKAFDQVANMYRLRWGWDLLPVSRHMLGVYRLLKRGQVLGVLMDQRPPRGKGTFYTSFLSQPTPFYTGIAKLGLMAEAKIYYVDAQKISRGKYSLEFISIDTQELTDASDASAFRLTDKVVRILEDILEEQPAYWLWTHKRWKHKLRSTDYLSERGKRDLQIHLP